MAPHGSKLAPAQDLSQAPCPAAKTASHLRFEQFATAFRLRGSTLATGPQFALIAFMKNVKPGQARSISRQKERSPWAK
jgi:hypothetical protein